VSLEGGGELTLAAGSLVGIDVLNGRPTGKLLAGEVTVRVAGEEPMVFSVSGGEVEIAPGATARLSTYAAPLASPEAYLATATQWIEGRLELPGPVIVRSSAGELRCGGLQIGVGEMLCLSPQAPPVAAPMPAPARRTEIDGLLADALSSEADLNLNDPADRDRAKLIFQSFTTLSRRIREQADQRGYIVAILVHLRPNPVRKDVRKRVWRMLALDPELTGRGLLVDALAREPDAFETDTVLALAESGVAEATVRLRAALQAGTAERQLTGAAVYFAFRGDSAGGIVLGWASSLDLEPWNSIYRFAGAAGLHRLGQKEPWDRAVREATGLAEEMLAAGRPDPARQLALRALYFHATLVSGEPVRVDELQQRMARFEMERGPDFQTPEQIRALLRGLLD
jgi:hypothetical protein